jgi:hypothetical protein
LNGTTSSAGKSRKWASSFSRVGLGEGGEELEGRIEIKKIEGEKKDKKSR